MHVHMYVCMYICNRINDNLSAGPHNGHVCLRHLHTKQFSVQLMHAYMAKLPCIKSLWICSDRLIETSHILGIKSLWICSDTIHHVLMALFWQMECIPTWAVFPCLFCPLPGMVAVCKLQELLQAVEPGRPWLDQFIYLRGHQSCELSHAGQEVTVPQTKFLWVWLSVVFQCCNTLPVLALVAMYIRTYVRTHLPAYHWAIAAHTVLPLSHRPLTQIKKVLHSGRARVCCIQMRVLIPIKTRVEPTSKLGFHPLVNPD